MKSQAHAVSGRGLAANEFFGSVTKPENIANPPASQAQPKCHNAYRDAAIQTLLLLRERFPATFAQLNARVRPPLKIGIRDELVTAVPGIDAIAIARALRFYTSGRAYVRNCVAGAERIGLDGKAAGVVTASEARWPPKTVPPQAKPTAPSTPPPTRLTLAVLKAAAAARKEGAS